MKIDLTIGGEVKTFSAPFISGRMLKNTIALANSVDIKAVDESLIDDMVKYIVMVYGKQFTADDLLDGIASDLLISTFQATIEAVTGQLNGKLVELQDPNAPMGMK